MTTRRFRRARKACNWWKLGLARRARRSAGITLTKADPDTGDSAVYDNTAMTTTGGWATGDGGVTYTKTGIYGTATLTTATGVVSYAPQQCRDPQPMYWQAAPASVTISRSTSSTAAPAPQHGGELRHHRNQ